MDDGTSERRACEVCGVPLGRSNTLGVCADKSKPECAKLRRRREREAKQREAPPKPEPKRCEICGKALNANNKSGLCDGLESPACKLERQRRWHADKPKPDPSLKPEPRRCDVCDTPLHAGNTLGICSARGKSACRKERDRRSKEGVRDESGRIFIRAGEVFGKWTALEESRSAAGRALCLCECGTEKYVLNPNLIRGLSRSCGCDTGAAQRRFPDPYIAAGTVCGRLTVLEDVARATDKVRCLCECGTEVITNAQSVKDGTSRSCGCLRRDVLARRGGFTKHPLYKIWTAMVRRCTDPKADAYPNYGGRGITVCDRRMDPWLFVEDIEREIGPRPEGTYDSGVYKYSLDRKDNESGYRPGNVKWSTQGEQVRNQRKVGKVTASFTVKLDAVTAERDALAAELAAAREMLAQLGAPPAGQQMALF